ncbi:DALR anticodon-binding domain-containing protein [Streptomyces sp. 6N223]|uniref:DALR anticodon-binding domain-containing protein n=1 Tax=Streptomyces sp. 6N223 TaxID=3457412 RepID=UPI003FD53377
MTPAQLSDAVLRSVRRAVDGGELGAGVAVAVPDRVPLRSAGGGWATGIALRLAGPAGRSAPEVAGVLRTRLLREPGVRGVEVAGGGFLTITLADGSDAALLREILARPRPAPPLPEDPARDAARWAEITGVKDKGKDKDRAALLVQRESNPLFLVRYAHARSRALERAADALRLTPEPGAFRGAYPHPGERALLRLLGEGRLGPGRLRMTADALLTAERERHTLPLGDEKPGAVHRARLALAQAAGTVLAEGLHQMGISAPDRL